VGSPSGSDSSRCSYESESKPRLGKVEPSDPIGRVYCSEVSWRGCSQKHLEFLVQTGELRSVCPSPGSFTWIEGPFVAEHVVPKDSEDDGFVTGWRWEDSSPKKWVADCCLRVEVLLAALGPVVELGEYQLKSSKSVPGEVFLWRSLPLRCWVRCQWLLGSKQGALLCIVQLRLELGSGLMTPLQLKSR